MLIEVIITGVICFMLGMHFNKQVSNSPPDYIIEIEEEEIRKVVREELKKINDTQFVYKGMK